MIGGAPTAYVRRAHDELLRVVLDPPVAASRLVVVRGGSSTGKTRAVYEAVKDQRADWRLDYPKDPDTLREHLNAGIPAHTVLWLGDLIVGKGLLLITAEWHEQWANYTAGARPGFKTRASQRGGDGCCSRYPYSPTPPRSIPATAGSPLIINASVMGRFRWRCRDTGAGRAASARRKRARSRAAGGRARTWR